MIEVSITIYPKPDKINEVNKLVLRQCEDTLKSHKGCFAFIPSISLLDDRTFFIKEKWYTTRDLVNYRKSESFLEYNEKLKTIIQYDNQVESFEHM